MASRWAFEAYMVTQYRDNPFERQFYDLDKTIYESEYKRVYYIPTLESKLAFCLNHRRAWNDAQNEEMTTALTLLRNEIGHELRIVGKDQLPEVNDLAIGKFDSTVYVATARFLTTLKQFYANKIARANDGKDAVIRALTDTEEGRQQFYAMKESYVNEAVSTKVKNTATTDRIVEYDGRLIQKIFPIYMDEHRPVNWFDFSANLYQPTKHFAGVYFDTLYFNIAVIWSMTVFLFITLYFDLLKKFVQILEGNRKYRRKERH